MRASTPRSVVAASKPLERAAWIALLVTVAASPLAITKFAFLDAPLTYTSFGFPQTVALVLGISLALVFWGAALVRHETSLRLSPVLLPFAAFAAWAVVATVSAAEPLRAALGKSTSSLSLLGIIAVSALLFLATQLVSGPKRLLTLTRTIVYAAVAVGGIALLQQLFGADVFGLPQMEGWMVGRGFSTLGNPDHLGTFLVLPTALAAGLTIAERDRNHRLGGTAAFALLATALVGTLTRGAWLGALAGLMVLAVLALLGGASRRRLAVLAVIVLAAAGVSLLAADRTDLGTRFSTAVPEPAAEGPAAATNAVLSDRLSLWRDSIDIALDDPLTGIGPASFELGWYGHAENVLSSGGESAIADDPHSLPLFVLATMGFPGAIALVVAAILALAYGTRTSLGIIGGEASEGELVYLTWTAGAIGLHAALLVGALSTPILAMGFVCLAVVVRPALQSLPSRSSARDGSLLAAASVLALLLVAALMPSLRAETALAASLKPGGSLSDARAAVTATRYNTEVQGAYYYLRGLELDRSLGLSDGPTLVSDLSSDLMEAGQAQPLEFFYPALRARILSRASEVLGPDPYAEQVVLAADDAIAIMPANLPNRVNKAVALADLGMYAEMAETLAGYWQNEVDSAYPGILYAQALALSGHSAQANEVWDQLTARFPGDASIDDARAQVESLAQPQ